MKGLSTQEHSVVTGMSVGESQNQETWGGDNENVFRNLKTGFFLVSRYKLFQFIYFILS